MTTLEKIKEKIVEAVPEIMELKFGCRVLWTYEHALNSTARTPITKLGRVTSLHGVPSMARVRTITVLFDGNGTPSNVEVSQLTIVGRPIQLADVLMAVSDPRVIVTSHRLEFRFEGEPQAYWDPTKSLEDQSPETHDFLLKVLTNT